MNMCNSATTGALFNNPMSDFERLPRREIAQFVYGVCQLKDNDKYVADLCEAICKTDIWGKGLNFETTVLICKGFVGMRYVNELWLSEVVKWTREHLSALPMIGSDQRSFCGLCLI